MLKKIFLLLVMGLLMGTQLCQASSTHETLTRLLSSHVSEEGVDYRSLCADKDLDAYAQQLNTTDPNTLTEKEQFAFWLNAYNAYSLKAICRKYPIKSINELNFGGLILSVLLKKSVWDKPLVKAGGKSYTLRQVDHEILRPTFKDPRIQFAISCGALGCPASRKEAYEADLLDEQLEHQTSRFINNPQLNSFDIKTKTASLSPLFNWSKNDFGKTEREVLLFIARYLPVDVALSIKQAPQDWKIKYNFYDLTLNDTNP